METEKLLQIIGELYAQLREANESLMQMNEDLNWVNKEYEKLKTKKEKK